MKLFTTLILIALAALISCSKHAYPSHEADIILYPSPPDTARIQFLTKYGSSVDVTGKQSRFKSFVAGAEDILPIFKPYGITVTQNKIFIVDSEMAGLHVIDLAKNSFEYFLPKGRGTLMLPINCHTDEDDNLYIADIERQQVVIFDAKGNYIGEIGGNENFKPTDVHIIGDTILISDSNNHQIHVHDRTSQNLLFSFPENSESGKVNWLYNPVNVEVKGDRIFVTDFGNSSVKIFNLNGEYLSLIGSYGRELGKFVRPKGIAVDQEMNLYVVDAGFQNIQVFNKAGQLLMFFGGPYNGPGDMYLPACVTIDYDNIHHYEKFVDPNYRLKYLILVTNQYGPDKVNVYGRIEPK